MNESIPSPVSKLLKGQTNIGQNTAGLPPHTHTSLAWAMVGFDLSPSLSLQTHKIVRGLKICNV